VRRVIPVSILAVLIVLSLLAIKLSVDQSNSPQSVRVFSCAPRDGVHPSTFTVFCADSNAEFTHLTWLNWGDETAYATGTVRWNDCTPNCADGKWKSEPVTLWAWQIKDHLYTRMTSTDPTLLGGWEIWSRQGGVFTTSTS
jgi:hypothetical protein